VDNQEATVKVLEVMGEELDLVAETAVKNASGIENLLKHAEAFATNQDNQTRAIEQMQRALGSFIDEVRAQYSHVEGRVSHLEKNTVTAEQLMRAQTKH
jgi:ABC-type transporter Mla subunit MlaD